MYHVRFFYSGNNGVWKLQPLLQKTCIFHAYKTLTVYAWKCLCTLALAHVCRLMPTYVSQGPLWSFIFKNRFFLIQKVIFSILTFLKSILFNWNLFWPQSFEFKINNHMFIDCDRFDWGERSKSRLGNSFWGIKLLVFRPLKTQLD